MFVLCLLSDLLIVFGVSLILFFNLDPWLVSLNVMDLYCCTPEDNIVVFNLLFRKLNFCFVSFMVH